MAIDLSEGWDGVADRFIAARSAVGASLVRAWAADNLPPGSAIVDVGCGSGAPIAQALVDAGFSVSGVDASPRLIDAFRQRFPDARVACEPAQDSGFFGRSFDAAVAIGLVFLLAPDHQRAVIERVAKALRPGGRFLFSAPQEACEWPDMLTGRQSRSLGEPAYRALLEAADLRLIRRYADEGGNNYYDAAKLAG